ncbi:MAG TPA: N-formylglutamate deformylase [Xanthomonadales bacterium]|nr:N-formylglutamate deformylase [Xanthomonadales bacterium]
MNSAANPELAQSLMPEFHPGSSPLLVSVPHAGTGLPPGMHARLAAGARDLPDTDWYVDRLYAFARNLGASMLVARASRLVVDLNRPPDDQPLYDASQTGLMTGVVPIECFSGDAVYLPGKEPSTTEITDRLEQYWQPYHSQLQAALEQIRERNGFAILLDAHSIRAQVPLLFDGVLPDLNLGSNGGRSATAGLLDAAATSLQNASYSLAVDGRFKGGYITRHYGQPHRGIHALQLEIAQPNYMNEIPPAWEPGRAALLQQHLRQLVEILVGWKSVHD